MSVSPFTFYRGSAGVMTEDLAAMTNSGLVTQLCGDAHLSNFGLFAAPDRSVIFDINDFDETNPGPFEWDVLRLATSFVLAGRDRSLPAEAIATAATTVGTAYRTQMQEYAGMPDIAVWYDRVNVDVLAQWAGGQGDTRTGRAIARGVAKARSRDMWSAVATPNDIRCLPCQYIIEFGNTGRSKSPRRHGNAFDQHPHVAPHPLHRVPHHENSAHICRPSLKITHPGQG